MLVRLLPDPEAASSVIGPVIPENTVWDCEKFALSTKIFRTHSKMKQLWTPRRLLPKMVVLSV